MPSLPKGLIDLLSKGVPETIFKYKKPFIIKFGSVSLSLVFLTYGLTFADTSLNTANSYYNGATDKEKNDWKFLLKIYSPISLAILPLTLSMGSLYLSSRVVSKITYIPKLQGTPECEFVRSSMFLGRQIRLRAPLGQISKSQTSRIFTGVGPQGIDDKSTFIFFLIDRNPKLKTFWNKFYILSRSGSVWNSDGRIIDSLFGDAKGDTEGLLMRKIHTPEQVAKVKVLDELIKSSSTKTVSYTHLDVYKRQG